MTVTIIYSHKNVPRIYTEKEIVYCTRWPSFGSFRQITFS